MLIVLWTIEDDDEVLVQTILCIFVTWSDFGNFFIDPLMVLSINNPINFQSFDIELLSFEKLPESDPEFCDFGTLRLKKKGKNRFVIDGDFKYLRNFADEIDVWKIGIINRYLNIWIFRWMFKWSAPRETCYSNPIKNCAIIWKRIKCSGPMWWSTPISLRIVRYRRFDSLP